MGFDLMRLGCRVAGKGATGHAPTLLILTQWKGFNLSIDQDEAFPAQGTYLCKVFHQKALTLVVALENIMSVIHFINFSWSRMAPTVIISYFRKI